jgi:hypothetical protein
MCMLPLSIQAVYMVLAFLRAPESVSCLGDDRIAVERKKKCYMSAAAFGAEGDMSLYQDTNGRSANRACHLRRVSHTNEQSKSKLTNMRYHVLMAVKMSTLVFWVTKISTFRMNIQPLSSALKLEAPCHSETLVSTCRSTRYYNPEEQHREVSPLKPKLV